MLLEVNIFIKNTCWVIPVEVFEDYPLLLSSGAQFIWINFSGWRYNSGLSGFFPQVNFVVLLLKFAKAFLCCPRSSRNLFFIYNYH